VYPGEVMKHYRLVAVGALSLCVAHDAKSQQAMSDRPTITIAAFEFGTVSTGRAPVEFGGMGGMSRGGVRPSYPSRRYDYGPESNYDAIGTGAADLVVAKLVESERFRVFERKALEAVTREQHLEGQGDTLTRARYLVTGSVSQLGNKDRNIGGLATGVASSMLFRGLGALRTSNSSTTIRITARVVDTRTGEIIGSFTSEGESKKRWGVDAVGAGRGGLGAISTSEKNFRETAIGEATERAAAAVAERLIELRATALRP
jgi:curli biogenesis system outer membrane secretion channel CsgG